MGKLKLFNTKLNHLKHISGVYLLEVDDHKYVGSSIDLYERLHAHRQKMRSHKHNNKYIQNCYDKYNQEL